MRQNLPCLFWAKRLPSALLPTKTVWQTPKAPCSRSALAAAVAVSAAIPRNSVAPRCFRHSFKLLCDASAPVSMLPLRLDASSPSRRSLCFRFLFRSPRSFLLPVSSKFRSPRSRALFLKLPHSSKLPLGSPFLDAQLFDDHRCGLCQMSRSALQTPLI